MCCMQAFGRLLFWPEREECLCSNWDVLLWEAKSCSAGMECCDPMHVLLAFLQIFHLWSRLQVHTLLCLVNCLPSTSNLYANHMFTDMAFSSGCSVALYWVCLSVARIWKSFFVNVCSYSTWAYLVGAISRWHSLHSNTFPVSTYPHTTGGTPCPLQFEDTVFFSFYRNAHALKTKCCPFLTSNCSW